MQFLILDAHLQLSSVVVDVGSILRSVPHLRTVCAACNNGHYISTPLLIVSST